MKIRRGFISFCHSSFFLSMFNSHLKKKHYLYNLIVIVKYITIKVKLISQLKTVNILQTKNIEKISLSATINQFSL